MMQKEKKWLYILGMLIVFILFSVNAMAQETVSGTVTDAESGDPLPGVNILVKGTSQGTTTNANGHYELTVSSLQDTLVFSYIGYQTNVVTIRGRNQIDITLQPKTFTGEELVVVGYGTQKESTVTGSVASVSTEELNSVAVSSVQQALKGRVSGVRVVNDGGPGEDPIVQIRGISSISFSSDPLFVVDGMPTSNISSIGSSDIASLQVLKDASAAAIYGSRATNGVILITTKKGAQNGELRINYNGYVGTQGPANKIDLLNTEQYVEYAKDLLGGANNLPPRIQNQWNEPIYEGASRTYAETNTDWQDAYFRHGLVTNQHLSISGGNEISRFYLSGSYYQNEGITAGLHYKRGSFRINSEHYLSDIVTIGETFYMSFGKQRFNNDTGTRTRLVSVIRSIPYLPVHDPTTMHGFRTANASIDASDPTNPVQDATLLGQSYNNPTHLMGTAYAEIEITPWLNFKSTFGLEQNENFQHDFSPIYDSKGTAATVATINNAKSTSTKILFSEQLTFEKDFGEHHIEAIGVYEYQQISNTYSQSSGSRNSNAIETLAGASNIGHQSQKSKSRLISYVVRLNYNYAEKYMVNLSIRRDGLSIWAPGHKWANFPAVSVGWDISQEAFMQNQDFISTLRLRAGYGVTGLNGFLFDTPYPWQVPLQIAGATYPFSNQDFNGNATYYNQLGNKAMEWEKTRQLNIGLDVGLLNNKITFTAEYYIRNTDNLLLQVPTPPSFGFVGAGVLTNVGEMENRGLDLKLAYHHYSGDFTWDISGLVSIVRNEVISLNTPSSAILAGGSQDMGGGAAFTKTQAGYPIQYFYGWVVDGIFQNQQEVNNWYQPDAAPGDIRFKDLNGDKEITAADRTKIGSYIPNFSYSLNFNAQYKNFDLSLFIQGVQGNEIFNGAAIIREGMARLFGAGTAVLNAWTPQNRDTNVPRAVNGDPNLNSRPSTRWIEDGSYLRLKNIELGYTVSASALASLTDGTIRNLRIYVSAQNLLTITDYSGWNPAIGGFQDLGLVNGVDYGTAPVARTFLVGIQLGL